uniref:FERM domain-containing protein n=1 Tax=Meloidogyne javanica TaxID=6303 RepID=A0A915MF29_MELJA
MPHSNNNSNSEKIQVSALPQSIDEGPSPFVQQDVSKKKLVMAKKNALGSVLLDLVIAQMGVQLEFFFKVKFYPPNPTQLLEDFSRHLLYLQLRKDVYSERLPVSFAAQASLGSLVAQAELGDYQPSENYAQLLSSVKIAQLTSEQEQFCNKVGDLHKLHRGLTRTEAELAYLNECKSLAMYGIHLFPAKDSKNKPIQIGISSVGISIFNDQMRVHRFSWAGIIKIEYRKNKFGIRLKPGELDQSQKKSTTVSYALIDYKHAKLVWRCGVEHHVFFRLVQPETKHKNSFLSFGSARFRYTGRTNIQSQMVSQLFETNAPTSASLSKSKSAEMLPQNHQKEPQTPLNYMDELTPQKQLAHVQPLATSTARSDKKVNSLLMSITDLPSTSSNILTSQQPENINLPLLFRHFDLQYSPIDNHVTLYNSGLYYEIDISRRLNSFGVSIAKGGRQRFQNKNNLFTRIWPYNEGKHSESKIISKFIHLTPHKHSSLLHHINCQEDLPYFPIIYFVAVRHSGFSKSPIKEKKVYKKLTKECFDVDNKKKNNNLFPSTYSTLPRGICFDPLRLEKVKELPTVALYSLCTFIVLKTRTSPLTKLKTKKVEPPPPPAQQKTTLETCHEEIIGPEQVTTEIDAEGNIIKRVVRTEQIRHTVQSHSVQSVPVDENGKFENSTTTTINNSLPFSNGHHLIDSNEETKGELVSSKVVTTGNRTVETLTYKTEKDGITKTRVEHRITIHSIEEIDHDSELSKAILEATSMNPELKVEKVEVSKK